LRLTYIPYGELRRLRELPIPRAEVCGIFADACRLNTLSMIMEAGSGHIGSSFSAMDIVAWLHLFELQSDDVYFSSKGHDAPGLYSVLAGTGALGHEMLRKLRRLDGLPGHPDVGTPGMSFNTGSLGMGISKAKGLVRAARLAGRERRVFVMTGDGELQEGQFWESLQGASNHDMHEITAVVDHNKMQSDTWVEKVSSLGDLRAKLAAFGWHVRRCDGNDPGQIQRVLDELRQLRDAPKIIIADTVKGKGIGAMENTALGEDELYRFHSGAPGEEIYQAGITELSGRIDARLRDHRAAPLSYHRVDAPPRGVARGERLVAAYSQALLEHGRKRRDLVVLDADLMLDCGLIPFRDAFPDRFIECGIAEQDMVSQAGALALQGYLPVVHSFACFLSTRPNEHIYNNATERSKIIYVASLAGLLPAGPGHSHQSVRDISALGGTPGLTMIEPCSEEETRLAMEYCVSESKGSCYLRLASVPCEIPYRLPRGYRLAQGRGVVLRQGSTVALVGYGPVLLSEAYKAAQILEGGGISLEVINLPWLNEIDPGWLRQALEGKTHLFTLDDHYAAFGQGQMVLAAAAELGLRSPPRATRMGLREVPSCGQNAEALRAHGLDAAGIAETVTRMLRAG
jgi:transketolase